MTRALTWQRCVLLVALCCAAAAWFGGPSGRLLALLPLLLFAPGLLIERWLRPFPASPPFLLPSLWLGLSLSVIALLYEWATALGVALALPALAALALACGLGALWQLWRERGWPAHGLQPALALLAVLALTFWTRFMQIRGLVLPNWVDSIHHALLIRVAAERGMAPLDLRPYLPIAQLPYHWGYHVFVATLMRLSGAGLPVAMLWSGQALNGLHALAAAGLAAYLWRRPVAGVAAAIVVGLISIMPAYYVSWGRYTQLSGLLLLAPLLACWLELLRAPSWRRAAALALLLAGLSLIHFIVLVVALLFMLVSGGAWLLRADRAALRAGVPAALAAGLGALGLSAPWMLVLARGKLLPAPGASALPLLGGGAFNALDPNLLWAGQNRMLIALALLAALWGLARRQAAVVVLLGWLAALIVAANPWLALYIAPALGAVLLAWAVRRRRWPALAAALALLALNPWLARLPFLSLITNEALVISLFLPLGLLIGAGAAWLWDAPALRRRGARALAALALAALAGWGAWQLRDVVNPSTTLASAGDLAAVGWAAEHTPPDARFLINTAGWLGTGRGSDGGWWLLPLAGRWTSAPPVIYDYAAPEYVRVARERNQLVANFRPGQEQQLYAMIDRERIGYVFLGSQAGPLTPASFPASAGFVTVYQHDGVTILRVARG
ncbi:hypothetical protein [Kouleothrix sp.]|uniref:hypothetical protein n=1 Tax=Kouleothrix sp. TaxID=2779161 RepID=UPI00391ABF46